MISPEEHAERMELYNKGLSDREMAKLLYLDVSTVVYWRKIRNLAPNKSKMRRAIERRIKNGMAVKDIADSVGCHTNTVYKYKKLMAMELHTMMCMEERK